jgi:hypothetical protein
MRLAARLYLSCAAVLLAQRESGELRLLVTDPLGSVVQEASCVLTGLSTGVHRAFLTDSRGRHVTAGLPFGPYRLRCEHPGFHEQRIAIEIRSVSPLELPLTLGVAPVETTLVVREPGTLLDGRRAGSTQHLGPDTLQDRRSASPGRSVLEMVNTQPGWLLEANGVLHPRGSEYDVQYVIDGVPLFDNRSPAFAQSLGIEEFESMTVRTANYPAEYGRKLGGVIEVNTERDPRPGFHGRAILQGGSFATRNGFASVSSRMGKSVAAISAEGMMTDRYLDAPVEDNFTNRASGGGFSGRFERDWSDLDRTRMYLHRHRTGFLVPNERVQQQAGQRQDRSAEETLGHISHQRVFSPDLAGHWRLLARDTGARLWANASSTPILPAQDRGFRELYTGGSLAWHRASHELKAGAEALFSSVHEDFSYRIATYRLGGVRIFDSELPRAFAFRDSRANREQAAFIQDVWHRGNLTVSAGLRFDHYRLVADETAWSPRLGAAYHLPSAGLVVRASYDRIFQTPAVENILLASSNLVADLGGEGEFLPLRPSRGNFFEAGFSKSVLGQLRLDGTWYRRRIGNFADDSLLLNTGVSFPIAFARADIHGWEAKLEVPRWGPVSGFLSYGNMIGRGELPVSGGLFLGEEADELLEGEGSFPISQDQRNTVRGRVRVQPHSRIWFAFGARYDSGLPVELEGAADEDLLQRQYGEEILDRVNFDRERVLPSAAIDASLGVGLWKSDRWTSRLQVDAFNLTNRLNVINFAGLFSGTAIEPRRSFAIRLQTEF